MSEFIDRIAAQRRILRIVNAERRREELFGLSANAISRWTAINGLTASSGEVTLLYSVAEALSFLATRSQDQTSDEYVRVSDDVAALTQRLEELVAARTLA